MQRFPQTLALGTSAWSQTDPHCFVHKLDTCPVLGPEYQGGQKQDTAPQCTGRCTNNLRSLEDRLANSLASQEGIREEVTSTLGFGGQVRVLQQSVF